MLNLQKKALKKGYLFCTNYIQDNYEIKDQRKKIGRVYQDKYDEVLQINTKILNINQLKIILNEVLKLELVDKDIIELKESDYILYWIYQVEFFLIGGAIWTFLK